FRVGLASLITGAAIAVLTTLHLPFVLTLQAAEPFFALTNLAASIAVSLRLTGGGEIHSLAHRLHGKRRDIDGRLGEAALQGKCHCREGDPSDARKTIATHAARSLRSAS